MLLMVAIAFAAVPMQGMAFDGELIYDDGKIAVYRMSDFDPGVVSAMNVESMNNFYQGKPKVRVFTCFPTDYFSPDPWQVNEPWPRYCVGDLVYGITIFELSKDDYIKFKAEVDGEIIWKSEWAFFTQGFYWFYYYNNATESGFFKYRGTIIPMSNKIAKKSGKCRLLVEYCPWRLPIQILPNMWSPVGRSC